MQHSWDSTEVEFNPTIIDESERIIEGIASAPIYDRQNELITKSALEKALPEFMVLPILTVQHKEFVAGLVKKAWFDEEDKLHIRAQLKNTREVNKVWDLIKSGDLNSFSISGMRHVSSCTVSGAPCVTTDISLNAITICGNNRVNPEAQFAIAKALFGDETMTDVVENDLTKSETVEEVTPVVETTNNDLAKAVVEELKSQGLVFKADDEKKEEKKEEVTEKEDEEKKCMKKSIEDLQKAFDELKSQYDSLSAKVTAIEDNPLRKSVGFQVIDNKLVAVDLNGMDLQKAVPKSTDLDEIVKMRMM